MSGVLEEGTIETRKAQDGEDVITITIPKREVADPLGIKPGDTVLFMGNAGDDYVRLSSTASQLGRLADD